MVDNSSMGLVMLAAEVAVTVTREERHQAVLARYPVAAGEQRSVAVELGWCTIATGKYRGQRAVEVRLDGRRVGELTYLMSRRYAPVVERVLASGGRPGCAALIQRGSRGLEVVLRLPRDIEEAVPVPPPRIPPPPVPAPPVPAPSPRADGSSKRAAWITAAVVALAALFVVGVLAGNEDSPTPAVSPAGGLDTSTTPTTPTTTTTTQPTTTTLAGTTTDAPIPSPPAAPVPSPPVAPPPAPRTTTQRPAPPPPEQPAACDPNYSGCVPVASDVDCAGGGGNGPAYVQGPVRVIGRDIYGLDRNGDGVGCE